MSESAKTKRVPKKESATGKKSAKRHSRETDTKKKVTPGSKNDSNILQYIPISIRDEDTDETVEWRPVRHPKVPTSMAPRYYVNKQGHICSNRKRKLKPMKQKGDQLNAPSYSFSIANSRLSVRLDEIMVYTFLDQQFDSAKQYIYHKDGQQLNCTLDNLIVCDISTLQELEIARLQELYSGTKYTVVRDIHDTLTFERYLVSDDGKIYSLFTHKYISISNKVTKSGYQTTYLSSDADAGQASTQRYNFPIFLVVIRSFRGRPVEKSMVSHINGNKLDNSLENLVYMTQNESRDCNPVKTKSINTQKKKKKPNAPEKPTAQPISKETRAPISHQYEVVSDMTHVSKMAKAQLLALLYINSIYAFVSIYQDAKRNDSIMTTTWHTKVQIPGRIGVSLSTTTVKDKVHPSSLPGIGTAVAFNIWKGNLQNTTRSTDIQAESLCHLWDQTI